MPTTKRKAKPVSKRTAPKANKKKTPMKVATESRHPLNLPRNAAETAAIEKLRRICLALPEATEKIAWGEPTWRAGKMFAQMETHHHGAEHVAVWLPAQPGVQEALVEEDPERYFRPPTSGTRAGSRSASTEARLGDRRRSRGGGVAHGRRAAPDPAPRRRAGRQQARLASRLDRARRRSRRLSGGATERRFPVDGLAPCGVPSRATSFAVTGPAARRGEPMRGLRTLLVASVLVLSVRDARAAFTTFESGQSGRSR
jgi:hypothetical protein